MQNRLLVIYNPKAGSGRSKEVMESLNQYLSDIGFHDYFVYTTKKPSDQAGIKRAAEIPHEKVVIVGGDGTISDCLNAFEEPEKERFMLIPCGSGNDFARSLYPELERAEQYFALFESSEFTELDLGLCNGRRFINGVGIGYDGTVAHWSNWKPLKWLGSLLRYQLPVLAGLLFYRHKPSTLTIEEEVFELSLFMLSIGNGAYIGGGYKLLPGAQISDGALNMVCLSDVGIVSRILHLNKVRNGRHIKLPFVKSQTFKKLNLRSEWLLNAHMDGQVLKSQQFEIELYPHKLQFTCLPKMR